MWRLTAPLLAATLVVACASSPPHLSGPEQASLAGLLPTDALLLGEQHDANAHHAIEHATVHWLAAQSRLSALVLEMAHRGHDTTGLPPDASPTQVRQALAWKQVGWPWDAYGPTIMAAVRAGVPVLGANLPRNQLRQAMESPALDQRLTPAALTTQRQRIRDGHCNTLPEAQIGPMTRMQIARDIAMADTVAQAHGRYGGIVLLVAGNGHVERGLGVPVHLPADLHTVVVSMQAGDPSGTQSPPDADLVWRTAPLPPRDYCGRFEKRRAPSIKSPDQ